MGKRELTASQKNKLAANYQKARENGKRPTPKKAYSSEKTPVRRGVSSFLEESSLIEMSRQAGHLQADQLLNYQAVVTLKVKPTLHQVQGKEMGVAQAQVRNQQSSQQPTNPQYSGREKSEEKKENRTKRDIALYMRQIQNRLGSLDSMFDTTSKKTKTSVRKAVRARAARG